MQESKEYIPDFDPTSIATDAERILERIDEEKRPGSRKDSCGLASAIIEHIALFKGKDKKREGIQTFVFTLFNLFANLKGIDPSIMEKWKIGRLKRNEIPSDLQEIFNSTFSHTVCVVTSNGKSYLFDLTFCQFLNEDNTQLSQSSGEDKLISNLSSDDDFVKSLYQNGFVELHEGNLRKLLLATSSDENYFFIKDKKAQAVIDGVVTSPAFFDKDRLDQLIFSPQPPD